LIATQQQRVRDRYPHTPIGDLKLLPSDRGNPGGAKAITAFSLAFHHRTWINRIPAPRTSDGVEFDRAKIRSHAA
jgi:hypothetical protein